MNESFMKFGQDLLCRSTMTSIILFESGSLLRSTLPRQTTDTNITTDEFFDSQNVKLSQEWLRDKKVVLPKL